MGARTADRDPLNDAVQCTVMALREHLLAYFKDCDTPAVTSTNVCWRDATERPDNRRLRHYEQHVANIKRQRELCLNNTPLARVSRNPHRLELYQRTLHRSPVMQGIADGLQDFLAKYLRGVEVVYANRGNGREPQYRPDAELIARNTIEAPSRRQSYTFTESYTEWQEGMQEYVGPDLVLAPNPQWIVQPRPSLMNILSTTDETESSLDEMPF